MQKRVGDQEIKEVVIDFEEERESVQSSVFEDVEEEAHKSAGVGLE